jgi:signal transduction histidine kinase
MEAKNKAQLLQKTYEYYFMAALKSNYSLDKIEEYFAKNIMGFGTPIDENLFSIDDLLAVIIRQREQSAGIEMNYAIKPVFHNIIANGNAAVFVDEITIVMNISNNKHEIFLRNTLVLEYLDSNWKIVHFHASVPVQTESETDTWGIDEWKKKNEELEKLVEERTTELRTSLETLKATQAQLIQSEKLASLGELTAGIAHEIQNPLNFVNNFSEMSVELAKELKEEVEKPEMDKALILDLANDLSQNQEKINHHGKRASSIVKGMLEHSRTSSGIKELTDINKMADEFLRLAYHGLRAKDNTFNADFKTDFDKNLPKINVVSQDIGRVLLNLVSNAFYAVGKRENEEKETGSNFKPHVTIGTETIDNQIVIKIKDNGTGMSEATKAKIFQPFFTTKPTGEGTGLGLSLSYDIVKAHGGILKCESVENKFTEFTIILPQ